MLRYAEDACVQCGLCKTTCPEKVISLKPQIDFRAATAARRIIKQEEPFHCIKCGKPFGVKSTVERITAKLEGTKDRSVVVNIDTGVDYGLAVKVMDIVNQADAAIILATEIDK